MSKYILPTYTGKLFDLENPTEEMICIEDIAHHLSLENRYNGATKFSLSVAQHSLLVCQMAPDELKLEALLHDAEEAYYKDFTAPLKKMLGAWTNDGHDSNFYYELTRNFFDVFIPKYKLKDTGKVVKEIDLRMASTEILQLIEGFPTTIWQHSYKDYPHYQGLIIREMLPSTVEQMFKEEYQKWRRN